MAGAASAARLDEVQPPEGGGGRGGGGTRASPGNTGTPPRFGVTFGTLAEGASNEHGPFGANCIPASHGGGGCVHRSLARGLGAAGTLNRGALATAMSTPPLPCSAPCGRTAFRAGTCCTRTGGQPGPWAPPAPHMACSARCPGKARCTGGTTASRVPSIPPPWCPARDIDGNVAMSLAGCGALGRAGAAVHRARKVVCALAAAGSSP